jgi:putative oxidoreductase
MNEFFIRWSPRLLSVLRIITAFLFVEHGMQKWLNFPAPAKAAATVMSLSGFAGLLELCGGALLLLGLFSRSVAFVLSGLMACAYFFAHAPRGFWPLLNRGELAVLHCFVFLYLWAAGPGPWSLDAWLRSRKGQSGTDRVERSEFLLNR